MPLPSSGTLAVSTIATGSTNAVGVVTPYSLNQLAILTGKSTKSVSAFYNWPGYGYKYGSPAILHDYGLSSRYSTDSSNIIDTSGNGRTGIYTSGTGNGNPITIPSGYYNTGYPGNIATHDSNQYGINLDNVAKYGGTAAFTWVTWFRVTSFQTNYPGLISYEGRGSGVPIGHTMHLSNESTTNLDYVRWNGTSNSGSVNRISFNSGGVPAFSFNKWYMAAIRYDGSTAVLELFINGTRYTNSVTTSNSVTVDSGWGVFNGLRYNNWLHGNFGYCAIYGSDIGSAGTGAINDNTRLRFD